MRGAPVSRYVGDPRLLGCGPRGGRVVGRHDGERHDPWTGRGEATGAVARRGPGEVQMCGAAAAAGARRAVAGVAAVADELDGGCEAATRARAESRARRGPAEVVGEPAGGGVPNCLCAPVG